MQRELMMQECTFAYPVHCNHLNRLNLTSCLHKRCVMTPVIVHYKLHCAAFNIVLGCACSIYTDLFLCAIQLHTKKKKL